MTREEIDAKIPGYSGALHWEFFSRVAAQLPDPSRILILGVYQGRDLAYLAEIFRGLGKEVPLIGVDKFEDAPCGDWSPEEIAAGTWERAGYGKSPDYLQADRNLQPWPNIAVWCYEATAFLHWWSEVFSEKYFDFVYVDTSHDEATTFATIQAAKLHLTEQGLIGGDDYPPLKPTWGVHRAVGRSFEQFEVFRGYCWLARKSDYRTS